MLLSNPRGLLWHASRTRGSGEFTFGRRRRSRSGTSGSSRCAARTGAASRSERASREALRRRRAAARERRKLHDAVFDDRGRQRHCGTATRLPSTSCGSALRNATISRAVAVGPRVWETGSISRSLSADSLTTMFSAAWRRTHGTSLRAGRVVALVSASRVYLDPGERGYSHAGPATNRQDGQAGGRFRLSAAARL